MGDEKKGDTIRKKMVSARRNELLAELFQRSHRIEKWGRGIKMVLEREPATEFEEVGTVQFVAMFRRNNVEAFPSGSVGEKVGETTQKTTQKILELIVSNPKISRVELVAEIGITADGVKYQLDKLRKQGILKRVGPDKGGYWEIVE